MDFGAEPLFAGSDTPRAQSLFLPVTPRTAAPSLPPQREPEFGVQRTPRYVISWGHPVSNQLTSLYRLTRRSAARLSSPREPQDQSPSSVRRIPAFRHPAPYLPTPESAPHPGPSNHHNVNRRSRHPYPRATVAPPEFIEGSSRRGLQHYQHTSRRSPFEEDGLTPQHSPEGPLQPEWSRLGQEVRVNILAI